MSYHVYYRGELSITPAMTEADAATAGAFLLGQKNEIFERAVRAKEDTDALWRTEMLTVSEERDLLLPVEDESGPGLNVWLRILQAHFMAPKGYVLNGQIVWDAEEPSDRGVIFVKDGVIEMVDDAIVNPGPTWEPNHYASPGVRTAVRVLLDSADNTGCTADLTVVSSKPLDALRVLFP